MNRQFVLLIVANLYPVALGGRFQPRAIHGARKPYSYAATNQRGQLVQVYSILPGGVWTTNTRMFHRLTTLMPGRTFTASILIIHVLRVPACTAVEGPLNAAYNDVTLHTSRTRSLLLSPFKSRLQSNVTREIPFAAGCLNPCTSFLTATMVGLTWCAYKDSDRCLRPGTEVLQRQLSHQFPCPMKRQAAPSSKREFSGLVRGEGCGLHGRLANICLMKHSHSGAGMGEETGKIVQMIANFSSRGHGNRPVQHLLRTPVQDVENASLVSVVAARYWPKYA